MEIDLQLARMVKVLKNAVQRATCTFFVIFLFVATLCPVISRKFVKTQHFFVIHKFPFHVQLTVAVKMFQSTLEFINAHLQQRNQVTSILHTVAVNFWLTVCWVTHVLTYCGYKVSYFNGFSYTHSLPPTLYRFCCAGMNSI